MKDSDQYARHLAAMEQDIARGSEMVDQVLRWVATPEMVKIRDQRLIFMSVLATYTHSLSGSLEKRDLVLLLTVLIDRLSSLEGSGTS